MIAGLVIAVDVWRVGGKGRVIAEAPVAQGRRGVVGIEIEGAPYSLRPRALQRYSVLSSLALEIKHAASV